MLVDSLEYTPTLRRQIKAPDSEGFGSPHYHARTRRQTMLGVALAILVIVTVFLMAVKSGLWA